jgi:hypothetical protein
MDPALAGASLAALPMLAALGAAAGWTRARSNRKREKIRQHLRKVDIPGSRKDMALLIAMGYDPTRHRLEPVERLGKRSMRVLNLAGVPVRSFTLKQLRTPEFEKRWQQALREVQLAVEGA